MHQYTVYSFLKKVLAVCATARGIPLVRLPALRAVIVAERGADTLRVVPPLVLAALEARPLAWEDAASFGRLAHFRLGDDDACRERMRLLRESSDGKRQCCDN